MVGSIDQPPDSLHRSKPVYKCDVLSHFAVAGTSLPFHACLPESFTKKPVVWASAKTAHSLTQRDSRHFRTSHQAEIPAEKRINAHIPRGRRQPTPPMAMQDMCRLPEYQEQSELENRAQIESPPTGAEWLGTSLDLHTHSQQHSHVLTDAHLLYGEEPPRLTTPTQGNMFGQVSRMWWDVSTYSNDYHPDLQHLHGDTGKQSLVDSRFVPSLSNSNSESYRFPLTPPSSTRSGGASPTGGTACDNENDVHNALNASSDRSASLSVEPSIPKTEPVIQHASRDLFPELTWSDEEFARLIQFDPLASDLNSVYSRCAGQPSLSSVWNQETQNPSQNDDQLYSHNQSGPWSNFVTDQPDYLNNYPPILPDAFDQAIPLVNLDATVPNHYFDTTQQSVQPAALAATPSSFEGLSPDIDLVMAGRRNSVKAHQRAAAKDRELIEWKRQGLSYKEIKARGGFEEAESTLRGRYRTLTKPKYLRVRKPEWQQKDVRIMHHI
jgi:hypothetical protein